eukprot:1912273-Prymnesium_polylepis.1
MASPAVAATRHHCAITAPRASPLARPPCPAAVPLSHNLPYGRPRQPSGSAAGEAGGGRVRGPGSRGC